MNSSYKERINRNRAASFHKLRLFSVARMPRSNGKSYDLDDHRSVSEDKGGTDIDSKTDLLYGLEERPPWYLWLLLSFQAFLMSVTTFIPNPLVMATHLCLSDDVTGLGEYMGTIFFAGGFASLVQTTLGIRLPIIQGPSASFIAPVIMLLKTKSKQCPNVDISSNSTDYIEAGSDEHKEIWQSNIVELQGALIIASIMEVILGFGGLMGILMRYISPLTTATAISLIGLSLIPAATDKGSTQWWICFGTIFLIILFSQYLADIGIPFFGINMKFFLLFPVLLAMVISWLTCLALTLTDVLPDKKGEWGYEARTDIRADALSNAQWFRFPYPGQWGTPEITAGGVMAMLAAVFAIIIESVGDYHACARLCEVPPPPGSAINRGIGTEGVCCMLAGLWGTATGFTSFSHTIAVIGLTKVGSRVVIQLAAVMLIIAGCVGKVGAFFSTVPDPIVGAMIFCMFGMVTACGISNLGLIDLTSTRNIFIFGFSMFFALSVPQWVTENNLHVGHETANQVLTVFCSTSMLVGGLTAFVLDNTIPGTLEERGIVLKGEGNSSGVTVDYSAYHMPFIQPAINRIRCFRYVPFCPGFYKDTAKRTGKDSEWGEASDEPETVVVDTSVNNGYVGDEAL